MLDILGDPATTGAVIVVGARGDAGQRDASSSPSASAPRPTSTLAAVVVNRVLPELFGRGEEEIFDALRAGPGNDALVERGRRATSAPVLDGARLAVTLRRTPGRAPHPAARRARPTLPLLYVPYLFIRTTACGSTRLVAEALGEELGD